MITFERLKCLKPILNLTDISVGIGYKPNRVAEWLRKDKDIKVKDSIKIEEYLQSKYGIYLKNE